ncbi:MAG TPA: bifunctional phosphoribosyl-AMP cyclohydrolase/phosphoribosyl-ATP diphosphatase HisIE [Nitrospiria bacterium]
MAKKTIPTGLRFNSRGLIPAVVQDNRDNTVLMLAYMNRESIRKTLETGQVHFWSRSRKKLWHKGATSGNFLDLQELRPDCDGDTLLLRVKPHGPVCHTGSRTCFLKPVTRPSAQKTRDDAVRSEILDRIFRVIQERKRRPSKKSYVSHLLKGGRDAILKKIGEESGELIIGSKNNNRSEVIWEMADLWFHTLVLLGHHGISPEDIYAELQSRFGKMSKTVKSRGS